MESKSMNITEALVWLQKADIYVSMIASACEKSKDIDTQVGKDMQKLMASYNDMLDGHNGIWGEAEVIFTLILAGSAIRRMDQKYNEAFQKHIETNHPERAN